MIESRKIDDDCEGEVKGKEELVLELKIDAKLVLKAPTFSSAEDSLRSPVLITSGLEDLISKMVKIIV
jgi:hypothetical protein